MLRDIIFFSLVTAVLFLIHATVYGVSARAFIYELSYWYLWLLVPSVAFVAAFFAVKKSHHYFFAYFFILIASWVGTVFILLCASLIYEMIRLIGGDQPVMLAVLLAVAVALSLYALWNGYRVVVRSYRIVLPNLTQPKRVIHLSDLHIGVVRQSGYLERVVKKCNELKPDVVLISGDLFDGSVPTYEDMLHPLDVLMAPCYLSHGNHELYEGFDRVREIISSTKVVLLEDRMVDVGDVSIIGVTYRQNASESMLGEVLDSLSLDHTLNHSLDHSKTTILLSHEPTQWDDARRRGIDLMLSGHTHNGQIVPFNLLIKIFYPYTVGLYEKDSHYLHVSPGTGTWGPPMRFGSHNQITLLDLVPAEVHNDIQPSAS